MTKARKAAAATEGARENVGEASGVSGDKWGGREKGANVRRKGSWRLTDRESTCRYENL